ncbi:helix-turn-helix domain-containing protein [Paucibacter sp. B2R-40]|uniref:GlxA family transcriptional regulator n=1 Tax=Paucibacter sp. B2R-40 TaxID=2893554 RepID=UPI0021E4EA31|nr:helix-turn-helix domain-containing protein [Paucibacter sp. B2R-40]MCV2356305.1 helix-turn-helix domain-containing protein [Paucibacter sp. B2R-40]
MANGRSITVGILVYPGCLASGAVGPADVFRIANTLSELQPARQRVHFELDWLTARREPLLSVGGLSFACKPLQGSRLDVLLLPGIYHAGVGELEAVLADCDAELQALRELGELIDLRTAPPLLAAACSGTCLLAAAGLLNGRRATTSWWLGSYFRSHYPRVELAADQLLVQDGNLMTSGGITSYFDLSLALIGRFGGDDLRQQTARVLVMDAQRASQAPYIASAMMAGEGHVLIERARSWLNARLDLDWTLPELAAHCNASSRTLLRRFHAVQGCTPVQYVQQLRVERARGLLESTQLSMQDITSRCGYEDVSTFSKVFKRWVELTPRDYRKRFGLRV